MRKVSGRAPSKTWSGAAGDVGVTVRRCWTPVKYGNYLPANVVHFTITTSKRFKRSLLEVHFFGFITIQ